jgi:hypothetical protein
MSMLTEACATGKPVHIFDLGEGRHAMRAPVNGEAVVETSGRNGARVWEKGHLKAFIYRQTMHIGPQRMTRDIRIVHRELVDNGHAVWLGDPFPPGAPPAVESVTRAVSRVRALFGLPEVEQRTRVDAQSETRLLRTAS